MSRVISVVLVAVTLAAVAPAATVYVRESRIANRCHDAGGNIDYARLRCDHTNDHPFVPFRRRHARLISETGMGLAVIALLALGLGVGEAARRRRSVDDD